MGSSSECRVPQFRHRRLWAAQLARLELSFFDLLRQLDPGNRYRRVVESLEYQHGPDSLLHSAMVLLHQVVQVLAGADLHPPRKLAGLLHFPHRAMRSRIGVQRDLRGHASVLHRAAKKRFVGVYVPVPTQKEIHRLTRPVDGAVQVHPLSVNLYIRLVHSPRSADGASVTPPAPFELWKIVLNPPQDRSMGYGDPSISDHNYQIARAQFEARVPAHAQNDDLSVEVPSFEQSFDRDEPFHFFIIAPTYAFAPEPACPSP